MFGISEEVLRYWEQQVPELSPKRKATGRPLRQYTEDDLRIVRMLHHLIREQGMTVAGARQRLHDNPKGVERRAEIIDRLRALRDELSGMRDALDTLNTSE